MTSNGIFARLYKPLLAAAALVIILAAVSRMATVVTTLMLAFLLTIVVAPYLARLERRGLSHRMALLVVMAVVLVVFLVFALTVTISVTNLVETLPTFHESFQSTIDATVSALAAQGVDLRSVTSGSAWRASELIGSFSAFLKSLVGGLANALLILFVFALFLLDANRVPTILYDRCPESPALTAFGQYSQRVHSYFVNMSLVNLVIAGLSTVLLVVLGVPTPLLWGVVIFILRFVPVIGFWLALIPLTITALVANGPQNALIAFFGIALIDGIVLNTLYYRLLGTGLNLSPAAMVVSLLFWTFVLGPLGALLALPLTVLIKVMILDDDAKMMSDIISYGHLEIKPSRSQETKPPT